MSNNLYPVMFVQDYQRSQEQQIIEHRDVRICHAIHTAYVLVYMATAVSV